MHVLAKWSLTWNNFHSLLTGGWYLHQCQKNTVFLRGAVCPLSIATSSFDLAVSMMNWQLHWLMTAARTGPQRDEKVACSLWYGFEGILTALGFSHPKTHSAMAVTFSSQAPAAKLAGFVERGTPAWRKTAVTHWGKHSGLGVRKPGFELQLC